MPGVKVSGGSGLSFTAKLDLTEIRKNAAEAKKIISDLTVSANGITKSLDTEKTVTQGITDAIKQQRLSILEANKAKADANALAAQEKAAQAEINTQIKQNTLARQEELAATRAQAALDKERAAARRATIVSNSQDEANAANSTVFGSITTGPLQSLPELEALKAELLNVQEAIGQVNAMQAQGTITTIEQADAVGILKQKEVELTVAIENFNAANVAGAETTALASVAIEEELGLLESLKITLAGLKSQKISIVDPLTIEADRIALTSLNSQIQETEAEMSRLNNIGKVGFDEFGNKISKASTNSSAFANSLSRVTDLGNIGARMVTQLSRQLIGLATGFLSFYIGAKAIEALIGYVKGLDYFSGRLDQAKHNLEAFNSVMLNSSKAAGAQIAPLKELYDATQNVTLSMKDRLAAAEQLRDQYPAEFQNSSALAIANGNLKSSYDELTNSIIAQAKATAVTSKIADLESKRADIEVQKQKIRTADLNTISRLRAQYTEAASKNLGLKGKDLEKSVNDTMSGAISQITQNQKSQLAELDKDEAIIDGTEKFLEGYGSAINKGGQKIKDANALLGPNLENFQSLISPDKLKNKTQLDNIQSALQTKLNSLGISPEQTEKIKAALQKVDDLEKQYQVKATKTVTTDPAVALLASQKNVLAQIEALKDKYASKDKTRNDQEQDDIIADFKKRGDLIDAQNVKYANYLKTHTVAQAKAAGLAPIDKSQLAPELNDALAGLAGRQAVVTLQQQVDQQKSIYKEYEDYKLKAGTNAADELYGTQIGNFNSYVDYLKSLQPTIDQLNSPDAKIKAKASATADFLKNEEAKANTDSLVAANKHLGELIFQHEDYEQRRKTIISNSNADINLLVKNGNMKQADQVRKDTQDELTALDEANFRKLDSYKILFDGVSELTHKTSVEALNSLYGSQAALYALTQAGLPGGITLEAYLKNIQVLKQAGEAIANKFPDELRAVGNALTDVSGSLSSLSPALSEGIGLLGKLSNGYGTLITQINAANAAQKGSAAQFSAYASAAATGIGLVFSIGSALASAGAKANAKYLADQKYASDKQLESIEAVNKAISRQITLAGQLYNTGKITSYLDALQKIKAAEASQQEIINNKLTLTGNAANDKLITQYNDGDRTGFTLGAIKQMQQLGITTTLAGKSVEELQTLLDSGKLDTSTSNLVSSLIDLKQQYTDTLNTLNEQAVGSSFSGLLDDLTNLFTNATSKTEDFADNFQSIIQKAILQSFKSTYLADQLQTFYTDLANYATKNGGLTTSDIASLQKEYDDIIKNGQVAFDNLQKITGVDLTNKDSTDNSATTARGQIQAAITEDTASRLYGVFAGTQTATLQVRDLLTVQGKSIGDLYQSAQGSFAQLVLIEANTRRGADNTDGIAITLKNIESNTKGTSMRGAGLG